jgi:hypothetical protein
VPARDPRREPPLGWDKEEELLAHLVQTAWELSRDFDPKGHKHGFEFIVASRGRAGFPRRGRLTRGHRR